MIARGKIAAAADCRSLFRGSFQVANVRQADELPIGMYELHWKWAPTPEEAERGWGESSSGCMVYVLNGGWSPRDVMYFALGHTVGLYRDNRLTREQPYEFMEVAKYHPLDENFAPREVQSRKVGVSFIGSELRQRQLEQALDKSIRPGIYTLTGCYEALFHPEGAHDARFGRGDYWKQGFSCFIQPNIYAREIATRIRVEVQGMTLRDLCFLVAGVNDQSGLGEAMPVGQISISDVDFVPASFSEDRLCRPVSASPHTTIRTSQELPGSGNLRQISW